MTAQIEIKFAPPWNVSIRRGSTTARSRRGIISAVKNLGGWTGWCRVRVEDCGDMMIVRPTASSGVCQIAFVTWE